MNYEAYDAHTKYIMDGYNQRGFAGYLEYYFRDMERERAKAHPTDGEYWGKIVKCEIELDGGMAYELAHASKFVRDFAKAQLDTLIEDEDNLDNVKTYLICKNGCDWGYMVALLYAEDADGLTDIMHEIENTPALSKCYRRVEL